ncbi:MAG TPA: peptide chain release factor H [Accumulibacter sp.]|nr:peptide chain release factor H [Accumulibacter sp.]HQC80131.1 peptide chain release factor H [Accumulibacter sp.]
MILLQISAASGPRECALAVAKTLGRLLYEARTCAVNVDVVELVPGDVGGTFLSALLTLDGEAAPKLARRWCGTVRWICASPFRPHHGRKNWFVGIAAHAEPPPAEMSEVRFEACRASGPGGQHVNKTDSAIRATHLATGISVKVQAQRSQHANKRLAMLLIEQKLAETASQAAEVQRAVRRQFHRDVERGNAGRVFRGENFEPVR